jgi:glyceraldehyde 3-phosphate dehydrogenase
MTTRNGINGFGRIGRQSLKALIERTPDVEVVAVNDLVPTATNALLFKHDSTYGAYPGTVSHTDDALIIDGREIKVLQVKDPAELPWADLGVDIVIESTGLFTDATKAAAHRAAGAKPVIISAPAKGEDVTIGWASTTRRCQRPITSSATPAARRTAWRRRPRSSTTAGRSVAAS